MDGVLTDISGIITNNFYIYSGIRKIYSEETIYCCFRLREHIKATLPKELLDFLGGNASKNVYDLSDNIIFLELNIKPPILKHLTLPFCIKKTINIFLATEGEFKGSSNYNFYTQDKEFKFLNKIIIKTPINKITLIRNLIKDNLSIVLSDNILNILNYYEKEENNN
jgi:hypothetical protein